jgi:hypothetical protein
MNKIRWISFCWLIFLFAFFLGLYVYDSKVWPYNLLKHVKDFVKGHVAENLSLVDKIKNDFNFEPSRHIKVAKKHDGKSSNFSGGFESEKYKELIGLRLNPRRKNPNIFLSDQAVEGYRVIYGTFDFDDVLHGAIMLNPDGSIAHVWRISNESVDWEHRNDTNVFPHGFEIAPDGSIVTAFDKGSSLTKYDYCGNVVWQLRGRFHHSIDFEGEDAIWVWKNKLLMKIDYNTGEILKEISLYKVMEANPDIDIFGIIQDDTATGSNWAYILGDYWHQNDIDPLPKELEHHYPDFRTGDLLVCLRSDNLIFVMDQETLKVKWWRQGLTRRPHDPDWNDKGTITIFNNNMHRGYSNIMEVNPVTYKYSIILDGKQYNFYTWWRGKHQIMPDGGILVTSPEQGRVFETDEKGDITFEFLNTYTNDKEYLALSEARYLPNNFFKELPQCE